METTLFYFVESTLTGVDGESVATLFFKEMRLMVLDDICVTYNLNAHDRSDFMAHMAKAVVARVKRVTSKQFQGGEGSRFMMHTVIFPKEGADPEFHVADKISVTAGCGKRDWDSWTTREQLDIREFMFDLNEKAGDPLNPMDIKVKGGRLTTVINVRDMVKN